MKHHFFKLGRIFGRLQPILKLISKIFLLAVLLLFLTFATKNYNNIITKFGFASKNIISFSKDPKDFLENTNNRTNFLILGLRGEGSEAIDLTDTMIILSINHADQSIASISIPRDLYVPSLKTKINAVYHYGNLKQENGGFILVKAAIQETLGLPIHYSTVINFKGFVEIIDLLGGLDIVVENSFVDTRFPIPGRENVYPEKDRYQTVEFKAGPQHLDGQTTLNFVRSRNSEGDEGTDFARSRRQQLVINALRARLLSTDFLLNKDKINKLVAVIDKNITTDITPDIYAALAKLTLNLKDKSLKRIPLSSEKESNEIAVLENPNPKLYNNQWVLIARDNNWNALKLYIDNKFKGTQ
jgi:LCP family protein required for cell wall assembly